MSKPSHSPRNCSSAWNLTNLLIPLTFLNTLTDSAFVGTSGLSALNKTNIGVNSKLTNLSTETSAFSYTANNMLSGSPAIEDVGTTDIPAVSKIGFHVKTDISAILRNQSFRSIRTTSIEVTSENFTNINVTTKATNVEPKRKWFYWVTGSVICAFGIVSNIMNLAVLSQEELNDSPYTYLTALAISDLSLLSLSFIHLVMSWQPRTYVSTFYDVYIFYAFGNIFFNMSVWLVVILTFERVMFVKRPLQFHSSRRKASLCCLCVFVLCAVINIPRFLSYEVKYQNGAYSTGGLEFRQTNLYYRISWAHTLLITFIPILILVVTNYILIHTLRKAARERASMRSNQEHTTRNEQARMTRTLVAIVVVFIVCTTPSAFVEEPIAYSLFGGDKEWIDYINSPSNRIFICISNWLLFINASLNFLLYCAFNLKYRKATKSLLKKLSQIKFLFVSFRNTDQLNIPISEQINKV